jgi:hypothetical protein
MVSFVYYLAAIGENGLQQKLAILSKNLNYIYNNIKTNFDIVINCYNSYDIINNFLQQFTFLGKKMFHNKPGVLTELFLTNPHNATIGVYDYILFMLDDVEIQEMNLFAMINIKEKATIEVLSPKVLNSTHSFMNSYDSNILTINNVLEVYCLLLTYKDFLRFLLMHTIENKWMWGADFLFGFFKIKAGVYNKCVVKHMLLPSKKQSKNATNNASKLMADYLKKMRFSGNIKEVVPVRKLINLHTGTSKTADVKHDVKHAPQTVTTVMGMTSRANTLSNVGSLQRESISISNASLNNASISIPTANNRAHTLSKANTLSKAIVNQSNVNQPNVNVSRAHTLSKANTLSNNVNVSNPNVNVSKANTLSRQNVTVSRANTLSKANTLSRPNVNQPNVNQPNVNQPNVNQPIVNQPIVNQPNVNVSRANTLTNKNSKFTLSNIMR